MLTNYYQAVVPYTDVQYTAGPYTAGTIQMVPGASGYVPMHQGRDSGDMELAYSSSNSHRKNLKLYNKEHETIYTWNRRPASFGMSDIGSHIDIYA